MTLPNILQKLLFLFLTLTGLYLAKDFLIPLCIAGILATVFIPLCNGLQSKKIPKSITVLVSLLILLLAFSVVFSLLGWKISELLNDLAVIKQKSIETGHQLQSYIFKHLHITKTEQFEILKNEQPSYSDLMQSVLNSATYIFTTLILVLVYFVFLLYYRSHIKLFILKLTEASQRDEMEKIILSAQNVSQQYLIGLSKMIVLLWVMYSIGFGIIGLENALFFAILCGLLEVVPYVGNITGTLLTVLVAAVHGANPTLLGGIVITYGIVQLIQGWILEPLILGPQVKINPLFTIIALVLGQLLWGIPGIILAIPMTAILKIICDHIEALKPYGFLIGEIVPTDKLILNKIKQIIKLK